MLNHNTKCSMGRVTGNESSINRSNKGSLAAPSTKASAPPDPGGLLNWHRGRRADWYRVGVTAPRPSLHLYFSVFPLIPSLLLLCLLPFSLIPFFILTFLTSPLSLLPLIIHFHHSILFLFLKNCSLHNLSRFMLEM